MTFVFHPAAEEEFAAAVAWNEARQGGDQSCRRFAKCLG
jgi:hypothetical protein